MANKERQIWFSIDDVVDGRRIEPSSVPLGILKDFSAEVFAFIRGTSGEVDASKLVMGVQKGSFALESVEALPADLTIWEDLDRLRQGSLDNVDRKRADIALLWQRRTVANPERKTQIGSASGVLLLSVTSATVFRTDEKKYWVASERYFTGTLQDMGGASPNLHLRLPNGKTLKLDATRDQIFGEEKNLVYHTVVIRVAMEENTLTGEIRNAKFISFAEYSPRIDDEQYKRATEAGRSAWADVEDPAAWVRGIRGTDH